MTADELRKSILQMAIQGKLVVQNPDDEPASVLLERIKAEKQRFIKEGKIKGKVSDSVIYKGSDNSYYEKIGKTEVCIDDEIPFEIPNTWAWVRHNDLFEISGGSQPPKSKFKDTPQEGYVRLFQIRDYGTAPQPIYIPIETATKTTQKGDILLARYGASLGKVFFAQDGAYNVAMAKSIPLFNKNDIYMNYLYLYYKSSIYQQTVLGHARSAQAGFNKEDLAEMLFPLPPLNEQHRIVERIKIFESYLEQYTSLNNNEIELTKSLSAQLRKSILQYAIQGKLVPQNPDDEPASVLLERIRTEKKKDKKGKNADSIIYKNSDDNSYYEKIGEKVVCIDNEIPFEIPDSWCWCRGKDFLLPMVSTKPIGDVFTYIDIAAIDNKRQIITNPKTLKTEKAPSRATRQIETGDTLFSMVRPYLKNIALVTDEFHKCIASTGFYICHPNRLFIYPQYLFVLMMSPFIIDSLMQYMKGDNSPSINCTNIENQLYPIPPIKEQERIYRKLDMLLKEIAGN